MYCIVVEWIIALNGLFGLYVVCTYYVLHIVRMKKWRRESLWAEKCIFCISGHTLISDITEAILPVTADGKHTVDITVWSVATDAASLTSFKSMRKPLVLVDYCPLQALRLF